MSVRRETSGMYKRRATMVINLVEAIQRKTLESRVPGTRNNVRDNVRRNFCHLEKQIVISSYSLAITLIKAILFNRRSRV